MKRFNAAPARRKWSLGGSCSNKRKKKNEKKKKERKKKQEGPAVIAGDFNREYTCHDSRRYSAGTRPADDAELNVKCVLMKFVVSRAYFHAPELTSTPVRFSLCRLLVLANLRIFRVSSKSLYRDAASLVYEQRKIITETLFNYRGKTEFVGAYRVADRSMRENEIRFRSFNRN